MLSRPRQLPGGEAGNLMEIGNHLGSRCPTPWQHSFIQQNILSIGHAAWQGFSTMGRGVVSCRVELPSTKIDWRITTVAHQMQFIPISQLDWFLASLELDLLTIRSLRPIVDTYQPQQELIMVLSGGDQMEIDWLRNMAIPPQSCYAQVQQRMAEFQFGVARSG